MDIQEKVYEIIKELGAVEQIDTNMALTEEIGFDSLNMVTLLVILENKFDISLSQSDMDPYELKTVGDVIELAEKYIRTECGDMAPAPEN